jgi:outer membrane protein
MIAAQVYNCLNQGPFANVYCSEQRSNFLFSLMEHVAMREQSIQCVRIAAVAFAVASFSVSASGQTGQSTLTAAMQTQAAQTAPSAEAVRRLSIDEAVKLALEQNLGIQIQRIDPQIQDVGVAQARSFWAPSISSSISRQSQSSPSSSALSGGVGATSIDSGNFATGVGLSQTLPWGASYAANFNNSRFTTTSIFNSFSPQLSSNLNLQFVQPLLRNFAIDQIRQQVALSQKTRDLSDINLESVITQTARAVRDAYWDLSFSINNLKAQQESLALSQQSLKDNQKRVEIGTMAPIDIVQAQAEVASNESGVIVAEAQIKQAQDRLRALILDPATPNFWTVDFDPIDPAPFNEQAIDVDAAVRNALDKRTDLRSAKNSLEQSDVTIRYFRNQIMPDVNAQVNYVTTGIGGTANVDAATLALGTGTTAASVANRGFGTVLGDVFQNQFPTWTVGVQINYPLGSSTAQANLARAKLQYQQAQTQMKNLELNVALQVRDAGRNVQTNQKRVQSARASRELQEKKLEAEEKNQAAGMSTSFFVFQAQRDLAQARTAEIQAISDYNKSLVDFEAVQLAPVTGTVGQVTVAGQFSR